MIIHKIEGMYLKCDKCGKSRLLPFDEASPKCDRYIQHLNYKQEGKGNQAKHICHDCVTAPALRKAAALAMVRVGI